MSKINYIHRRRVVNGKIQNNGGQTIAFRELDNGNIEAAFAFCNPKDNFSRASGRVKAAGRLNSNKYREVFAYTYDEFIIANATHIYE